MTFEMFGPIGGADPGGCEKGNLLVVADVDMGARCF